MKRGQYLLLVALTVISGFIGGVVSNQLFNRPAVAQESENRKVIEAQEFRVVDENGKIRTWLTVKEGAPSIVTFDENGRSRIGLTVINGNPSISIRDENGKNRIWLVGKANGNPNIFIYDLNGIRQRVMLKRDD
jgi:hypothetical protein